MTMPLLVLLIIVVLGVVGARYGVDTRDGADWDADRPPRAPRRRYTLRDDLAALGARLARAAARPRRSADPRTEDPRTESPCSDDLARRTADRTRSGQPSNPAGTDAAAA